jgi:uncharacterized protein (TIGR02001 family)
MKSATWGAASLFGAALFAGPALADGMPSRGKVASAPESRVCSTAGNVGVTSDYVFRGISQSNEEAAIQGGVDFTCGKFYAGFWGSSIGFGNGTEIDLYGGYKTSIGRLNIDLGFIYYGYPGAASGDNLDYYEFKASANADLWKGGNLGGTVFYSPEYTGNTGPVTSVEVAFSQALPKVGMFTPTFGATVGRSIFSDDINIPFDGQGPRDLSYTYWNVGLTLGFLEKWSLDLRYSDTDGEGLADVSGALADERFLATLKYTF